MAKSNETKETKEETLTIPDCIKNNIDDNMKLYNYWSEPEGADKTKISPQWVIKKLTEVYGQAGVGWKIVVTDVDHSKVFTVYDHTTEIESNQPTFKKILVADENDNPILDTYGKEQYQTVRIDRKVREVIKDVRYEQTVTVQIRLYTHTENGEWSDGVYGCGSAKVITANKNGYSIVDDDAIKKAKTDAFMMACLQKGLGASVYVDDLSTVKHNCDISVQRVVEEPTIQQNVAEQPAQDEPKDKRTETLDQFNMLADDPECADKLTNACKIYGHTIESARANASYGLLKLILEAMQ